MRLSVLLHNAAAHVERSAMLAGLMAVCLMSMCMNGWFGWHAGAILGLFGSIVSAVGYVGCELIKYRATWYAGHHWAGRSFSRLAAAVAVLVCTTLVSFQAQIGFIGLVMGDTAAARSTEIVVAADAGAEMEADRKALALLKANPRYASSAACTHATSARSVALCQEIGRLEARLEGARQTVERSGDVGVADPVVAVLSWLLPGRDERSLSLGKSLMLAAINEVLTALGWLAAGLASQPRRVLGGMPWRPANDLTSPTMDVAVRNGIVGHPGLLQLMDYRRDRLEPADGHWLTFETAYLDYLAWIGGAGRGEPFSRDIFRRLMRSVVPERPDGDGYQGWRLRLALPEAKRA